MDEPLEKRKKKNQVSVPMGPSKLCACTTNRREPHNPGGIQGGDGKGGERKHPVLQGQSRHGNKGNGGTGWRISHVKPSRRERRGTALEGLTSMSKATENMGTDRVGEIFWKKRWVNFVR